MQVLLLLILKVHLKSGTLYFLLKYGCHCVTSTFTKVNIYLVICTGHVVTFSVAQILNSIQIEIRL